MDKTGGAAKLLDAEAVIDRIALSARDRYFNEEATGGFPNLALHIRDALSELYETLAEKSKRESGE